VKLSTEDSLLIMQSCQLTTTEVYIAWPENHTAFAFKAVNRN